MAATKDTASAPAVQTAPAAATEAKTTPKVGSISTAVALPEITSKRGSVSIYPFGQLAGPTTDAEGKPVYASFHVSGVTKEKLSTVVSTANRKNRTEKRDGEGKVVFKTKTVDMGNGTKSEVPTSDAEMVDVKKFVSVEVGTDDPEGKGVRVFRIL